MSDIYQSVAFRDVQDSSRVKELLSEGWELNCSHRLPSGSIFYSLSLITPVPKRSTKKKA